jgi:hypothetical protein
MFLLVYLTLDLENAHKFNLIAMIFSGSNSTAKSEDVMPHSYKVTEVKAYSALAVADA